MELLIWSWTELFSPPLYESKRERGRGGGVSTAHTADPCVYIVTFPSGLWCRDGTPVQWATNGGTNWGGLISCHHELVVCGAKGSGSTEQDIFCASRRVEPRRAWSPITSLLSHKPLSALGFKMQGSFDHHQNNLSSFLAMRRHSCAWSQQRSAQRTSHTIQISFLRCKFLSFLYSFLAATPL